MMERKPMRGNLTEQRYKLRNRHQGDEARVGGRRNEVTPLAAFF
jgi:hypothetical protein